MIINVFLYFPYYYKETQHPTKFYENINWDSCLLHRATSVMGCMIVGKGSFMKPLPNESFFFMLSVSITFIFSRKVFYGKNN